MSPICPQHALNMAFEYVETYSQHVRNMFSTCSKDIGVWRRIRAVVAVSIAADTLAACGVIIVNACQQL